MFFGSNTVQLYMYVFTHYNAFSHSTAMAIIRAGFILGTENWDRYASTRSYELRVGILWQSGWSNLGLLQHALVV